MRACLLREGSGFSELETKGVQRQVFGIRPPVNAFYVNKPFYIPESDKLRVTFNHSKAKRYA
jgi:hypothetical protein